MEKITQSGASCSVFFSRYNGDDLTEDETDVAYINVGLCSDALI
jgi:hypothetical protein